MRLPLLLIAVAGLHAPGAAAQLYKCTVGGKVVYQDQPCDQGAKQSTIRAPEAGPTAAPAGEAPAAAASAPVAQTPVDVENVVRVISGFQSCANDLDGYTAKHSAAYNSWRARNQASITKYNQDAAAQKRVRDALEEGMRSRPQDAQGLSTRADSCDAGAQSWFAAK